MSTNNNNDNLHALAQAARRNSNCPDAQKALRVARFARSKELGLIVSPQDAELMWSHSWSMNHHGYAHTNIKDRKIGLHQLVHARMTGQDVTDRDLYNIKRQVRHVDNDNVLDCRRENIYREQSSKLNQREVNKRIRSDSTSGVSGVAFIESSSKWQLRLRVTGPSESEQIYFGLFESIDEAAFVRNALVEMRASFSVDISLADAKSAMLERRDALRAAWAELMTDADDLFTDEEAA